MNFVENMSVEVEDARLSIGDDALNHSTQIAEVENGTILECEAGVGNGTYFCASRKDKEVRIKAEKVNVKSEAVSLPMDISRFIDVPSSSNDLSYAHDQECNRTLSLPEVATFDTSGSSVAETNIIKKEEDLDLDENVFEAVIESRFGISTNNDGDFERNGESFQTAPAGDEASEISASGLQVCSSLSDTNVCFSNIRCKSEEQPRFHLQKSSTYHDSSYTKVRDVRVALVDILPKRFWKSSTNASVNHIDSKSCVCVLCVGRFRLPVKTENRIVVEADKNGTSNKSGKSCGKLKDGKWYLCGACPARFIFAHNLGRHSVMDHHAHLCLVCHVRFECDSDLQTHSKMHLSKKQYSCLFCKFRSKTEAELEVHLQSHSGQKCFSCAKCKLAFEECYNLVKHVSEHGSESQFMCKDSTSKFTRRESQEHIRSPSREKVLSCTYCPVKVKFGCRLKDHIMQQHTNEGPLACRHCSARFIAPSLLKAHLVKHSSVTPFACSICPAKFKRPEGFKAHLLTHNIVKPYSCPHCDTKFRCKGSRNRHVKNHLQEKRYMCPYCNLKLTTAKSLKYHCMTHTNEKPHRCSLCPAKFRTASTLKCHMQTHTNDVRLFSCEHCSAKFRLKTRLWVHLMDHTGERPFKCNHCAGMFKTKSDVKKHAVIHSEARPFKCGECDAAFKSRREVKQHHRTHSNDKPFACDLCPATFKMNWTLNLHRKIHTREALFTCEHCDLRFKTKQEILWHSCIRSVRKPFACRHCSAEFRFKSRLIRHAMQRHSDKKLFSCAYCPAKFKLKEFLNKHLKSHHTEGGLCEESVSTPVKIEIKEEQV